MNLGFLHKEEENIQKYIYVGLFLIIYFCLHLYVISQQGPTQDEPVYIAVGHYILTNHSLILNPYHPPLIKMISALPSFLSGVQVPLFETFYTQSDLKSYYGFFFKNCNVSVRQILIPARIAVTIFNLLLLSIISFKLIDRYGQKIGVSLLLICAFTPTFFAHFHLVSMDVPSMLVIFLISLVLLDLNEKKNLTANLLYLFLLNIICLLVKTPTIVFWLFTVPVGFLVMKHNLSSYKKTILAFLAVYILPLLLIAGLYNYATLKISGRFISVYQQTLADTLPVKVAQKFIDLSSNPEARGIGWYLTGLIASSGHALHAPVRQQVLLNELLDTPSKLYFLKSFLVKESEVSWIIFSLGLIGLIQAATCKKKVFVWLLVFTLFYSLIAVFSNMTQGIRYILPLYGILLIGAAQLIYLYEKRFKKIGILLLIFVFIQVLAIARSYPDLISYSSVLFGDSQKTENYVSDSNFDWGQDSFRLIKWLSDTGQQLAGDDLVSAFSLDMISPSVTSNKVKVDQLPLQSKCDGLYALSKQRLVRAQLRDPKFVEKFYPNFILIENIGKTISIYKKICR